MNGINGVSIVEVDHDVLTYPATDGEITINLDNVEVAEQTFTIANPEMFYKKPKWYQWRLRRKYRRILEIK